MFDFSIKISNYKCFKNETGLDRIQRVNLVIGRNNSGKSSLLDVIEMVTSNNYEQDRATWRDGKKPQIVLGSFISEAAINQVFPSNTSGGEIPGNHRTYGSRYLNREIYWTKTGQNSNACQLVHCDNEGIQPPLANTGNFAVRLLQQIPIPLEGKIFRRVFAERDITPEADSGGLAIQPNGTGITNAIQRFINRSNLPSKMVEEELLSALNEIFAHDAKFTDIVCQLHENNLWEIYLEEEHKGRIALSKSGSGLKTVIAVLCSLILVPQIDKKNLNHYVFGFEELENNIHPSLLRRLNDYLYKSSVQNNFIYFITTHSNVLIDQFSKQDDAQIIHITQSSTVSECTTATTYVENNGILDDLDVRASDLLQANGIIWVEGPSDRVYLNRWINLWSEGELREGTHYQIIFYGGRLLSHLSAESPEDVDSGISILNTNRNALILIDSDKRNQQARLNPTKLRVRQEFENMNATCWITRGKEIENYIPGRIIEEFFGIQGAPAPGQYESFFEHIDNLQEGMGNRYLTKKSLLAEKLVSHMNMHNMQEALDIDERMIEVCTRIREWNS